MKLEYTENTKFPSIHLTSECRQAIFDKWLSYFHHYFGPSLPTHTDIDIDAFFEKYPEAKLRYGDYIMIHTSDGYPYHYNQNNKGQAHYIPNTLTIQGNAARLIKACQEPQNPKLFAEMLLKNTIHNMFFDYQLPSHPELSILSRGLFLEERFNTVFFVTTKKAKTLIPTPEMPIECPPTIDEFLKFSAKQGAQLFKNYTVYRILCNEDYMQ
ncbi:hypothetical protein [Vibrio barjaei]|uniref:hypothetical protein n=1 Tax=Vibrio barjaei TaxID=1676683 RepID=UPI002285181E|nr:hypothetical protein [Vibrio barjaei]MCY9874059.1 hypothetical protein [Vibrio barjaei]